MIIAAELSSVWLLCLPQKPWFYDIWQTWVGYPFQVSFWASGQWPPGVPGISPLAGIIHSSLFPAHGHRLKRCGTEASPALFREVMLIAAGLPWDLPVLQDFPGICLCCFPLQPDHCYFHPPRDISSSLEMLSGFPDSVQNSCTAPGPMVPSRHSDFNNSAPSCCLLIPVLGRGQEYK